MKKRLVYLVVLGVMGISLMAAAPASNNWAKFIGALTTIDSQYTDDQWELLDSIIVIKDDTCYTVYTMSGVAVLNENDKLYIGFDDGGGAGGLPVDTFIIEPFRKDYLARSGEMRVPFTVKHLDSLVSQTDANDTIYFYMAVFGSTAHEKVDVEDLILVAEVLDFNAGGVVGE